MANPLLLLQAIKLFFDNLDGGDFPDSTDEYIGLLKYDAFEDPEPEQINSPTENLNLDFDPVVNNTNTNIVNVYNQPTTINILSGDSVNFPSSNLPIAESIEQSGQTQTKITIGSPITLAQSALEQNYGRFVYAPISPEIKTIQRIVSSNFGQKFQEEAVKSADKYLNNKIEGKDQDPLDSIAYLFPSITRGNRGKMTLIMGVRPLRMLSQYYSAMRANSAIGILDEIPSKIEFSNKEIEFSLDTENDENLILNSGFSLKDIFGKYLDSETDWYEELKTIAEQQIDLETKEENPIKPKSLVEILLNSLGIFFNKLGLEDFPITVPESLTQSLFDKNGSPIEPKTTNNYTIIDLLMWQFERMDELIGQFPIEIEIQDTDLIKTGDQSLEVRLPNLAETLAEMTGKMLTTESTINAVLAILQRNLAESGMTKQQAIKNYYQLIATQEYLGYKTKKGRKDVDFLFNPKVLNEETKNQTLAKALETSQLPVEIDINDDGNTLEGQLAILVEAARIMKAQNFRKFSVGGDIKAQIIQTTKNSKAILDKLDEQEKATLEKFFDAVENGFITYDPTANPSQPYGRPFEHRPKVKDTNLNAQNP